MIRIHLTEYLDLLWQFSNIYLHPHFFYLNPLLRICLYSRFPTKLFHFILYICDAKLGKYSVPAARLWTMYVVKISEGASETPGKPPKYTCDYDNYTIALIRHVTQGLWAIVYIVVVFQVFYFINLTRNYTCNINYTLKEWSSQQHAFPHHK